MFTKMASIFTLIKTKSWKFDTTILNDMVKLCANLKSTAVVVSEIEIVKERYGQAGSAGSLKKLI